MGNTLKYIFWMLIILVGLGYFVQDIEVEPTPRQYIKPALRNEPPDPNRSVVDYDWNNNIYIYEDMVGTYIQYANKWYYRDSLPSGYYRNSRNNKPKSTPMEAEDYELEIDYSHGK